MAALPFNRNLSCSDKVLLTGSSGFSSSLTVLRLPWGISSMSPIETPSTTKPIPNSNEGSRRCLIGCTEAEVYRSSIKQRGRGMGYRGEGAEVRGGHN